MRTTQSRYQRDHKKLNLAIKLIQLNARTTVIKSWTGLSSDRIRKLVKYYRVDQAATPIPSRHRGRYPTLSPAYSKNPTIREQANLMGGLLASTPLLTIKCSTHITDQSLEVGHLLCNTYHRFVELEGESRLSIEHLQLVWRQLSNRTEITLTNCRRCQAIQVVERYQSGRFICSDCEPAARRRNLNG